jgi:tape measure domain-containing protein
MADQNLDLALRIKAAVEGLDKVGELASTIDETKKALLGLVGISLGVEGAKKVIELADDYQKLENRIKAVLGDTGDYKKALDDITNIAKANGASIDAVAELYSKLTISGKQLNLTQQQTADITQVVAESLKQSGAGAYQTRSAMIQLGDVFSTGALTAQHFNALMMDNPKLMSAVADALGLTIGQMKELGSSGMLGADEFAQGLLRSKGAIDAAAGAMSGSLSGAFNRLAINFESWIGQTNQSLGVTNLLASGVRLLADHIGVLEVALGAAAAGGLAKMVTGLTGYVTSTLAARSATTEQHASLEALAITENEAAQGKLAAAQAAEAYALSQRQAAAAALSALQAESGLTATDAELGAATEEVAIAAKAQSLAMEQLAAAETLATGAQERLASAQSATAASGGVLKTAMGALGGPVGVISLAAVAALSLWEYFGKASVATEDLGAKAAQTSAKLDTLNATQLKALIQTQAQSITQMTATKVALDQQIDDLQRTLEGYKKLSDQEVTSLEQSAAAGGNYLNVAKTVADIEAKLILLRGQQATATDKLTEQQKLLTDEQNELNLKEQTAKTATDSHTTSLLALEAEMSKKTKVDADAVKASEEAVKAAKAESEQSIAVTKVLGDEVEQHQAVAAGARKQADAAVLLAGDKRNEALVSQGLVDVYLVEESITGKLSDKKQELKDKAVAVAQAKQAEAVQSQALADKLNLEAAAAKGEATGLAAGKDQLDHLRQACIGTQAEVTKLTEAQKEGKATDDDVKTAILNEVEAFSAYKAALGKVLESELAQVEASQRATTIAQARLQVVVDHEKALEAEAKATGDNTAATQAGIAVKQLEAEKEAALVKSLQSELTVLQQRLDVKKQESALEADQTAAQAEIKALEDEITQKEIAIEDTKEHVTQLTAEADAAEKVATATTDLGNAEKATNQDFLDYVATQDKAQQSSQSYAATTTTSWKLFIPLWDTLTDKTKAEVQQLAQMGTYTENFQNTVRQINREGIIEQSNLDTINAAKAAIGGAGAEADAARKTLEMLSWESQSWGVMATKAGQDAVAALQAYEKECETATSDLLSLMAQTKANLGDQSDLLALQHEQRLQQISDDATKSGADRTLVQQAITLENQYYEQQVKNAKVTSTAFDPAAQSIQKMTNALNSTLSQLGSVNDHLVNIASNARAVGNAMSQWGNASGGSIG